MAEDRAVYGRPGSVCAPRKPVLADSFKPPLQSKAGVGSPPVGD
jgi:hypothetical protein